MVQILVKVVFSLAWPLFSSSEKNEDKTLYYIANSQIQNCLEI